MTKTAIGQPTGCERSEHAATLNNGGHVIYAVGGNGISEDGICVLPAGAVARFADGATTGTIVITPTIGPTGHISWNVRHTHLRSGVCFRDRPVAHRCRFLSSGILPNVWCLCGTHERIISFGHCRLFPFCFCCSY